MTLRFTPLQTTTFEQLREAVLTTPRESLLEQQARSQTLTTQAIIQFKDLFGSSQMAPVGGNAPLPAGFLASLLTLLTDAPGGAGHRGVGQSLGDISRALKEGLEPTGPLLTSLVELKKCVCQRCADEPGLAVLSESAVRLIATLRPIHNILTDQTGASVKSTNIELARWHKSKPALAARLWLQGTSDVTLAADFWDQGRELGVSVDQAFEVVRRARLLQLLRLQLRLAQQFRDEPLVPAP